MKDVLHFAVGIFGNWFALSLFLARLNTFIRIIIEQNTGQFSGIPYVMSMLDCLFSAWYGLPLVSPNNLPVLVINLVGAVIESIYVVIFLRFVPNMWEQIRILVLLIATFLIFVATTIVSVYAVDGSERTRLCGITTTVFSILTSVVHVIQTENAEHMPWLLSLSVFCCGTTWMIFGILGNDLFVTVPNGVDSALGLIQLIVCAIYRNHPAPPNNPQAEAHDAQAGQDLPPM